MIRYSVPEARGHSDRTGQDWATESSREETETRSEMEMEMLAAAQVSAMLYFLPWFRVGRPTVLCVRHGRI